ETAYLHSFFEIHDPGGFIRARPEGISVVGKKDCLPGSAVSKLKSPPLFFLFEIPQLHPAAALKATTGKDVAIVFREVHTPKPALPLETLNLDPILHIPDSNDAVKARQQCPSAIGGINQAGYSSRLKRRMVAMAQFFEGLQIP